MRDFRKARKEWVECLFWAALGCCVLAGTYLYGFGNDRKKIIMLVALMAAAILIHRNRSSKTPGYMKKVLGLRLDADRRYEYDWLRILAVVLVIVTHTIQLDLADGRVADEKACYFLTVLYVFCLACNLLYVMLSGGLLMPWREEKLSDFYLKRVARVVLPLFVYFVFYLWITGQLESISFKTVCGMLSSLFQGDTPKSPHFWLMYIILSIYVVVPFFRYMFKNMPYKVLSAMVAISLIFMFFMTYSPISCAVEPILASWTGVAVCGYWIMREETRRYDKFIILSGVVGLGITMYCIKTTEDFAQLCCNCSPTMVMIAGGLFSLVFSFPQIFTKGGVVLNILGKYSYSLILVHWGVLVGIVKGQFHIYTDQYCYIGGILLSLVTTLLISLAAAFLIDNMVLVVVEWIYDFIIRHMRLQNTKT